MKNCLSLKGQNRGASLIAVLVTLMFVSMMGIVISQITITNIQMKEMEQSGKTNFYSTEKVMDILIAGMNAKASDAMQAAYQEMLTKYRTVTSTGGDIQVQFGRLYLDKLIAVFESSDPYTTQERKDGMDASAQIIYKVGSYSFSQVQSCLKHLDSTKGADAPENIAAAAQYDKLKDCLTVAHTGDSVASYRADYQAGSFVLEGIKVTYTDPDTGYTTSISSDIVFDTPHLNFEGNYMVKEFMRYSLIANKSIHLNASNIKVYGNVYAGAGGIYSENTDVNNTQIFSNLIVTRGDIKAKANAKVTIGDITRDEHGKILSMSTIWAENIVTEGNSKPELTVKGNIFVSDDLEMNGNDSTIKLEGAYYGYNFQKNYATPGIIEGVGSQYSSAIVLNGRNSKLVMTGLSNLMLSGRTFLKRNIGGYDMGRADVPLGESISVRSDQMAYYIPDREPYLKASSTSSSGKAFDNSAKVSNFLGISNIEDYVDPADPVIAFYYRSTAGPDKPAYFLKFRSDQSANKFFAEYYANNAEDVSEYSNEYVDNNGLIIPLGSADFVLTARGDILYRESAGSDLKAGLVSIALQNLDSADFYNYAGRLAAKYKSLECYLEENHDGITPADVRFGSSNSMADKSAEGETLLDNLLSPAAAESTNTYALQDYLKDKTDKRVVMKYDANGTRNDESGEYVVALVDNVNSGAFEIQTAWKGGIIIATGDISVFSGDIATGTNFTGCIISGGKIEFAAGAGVNANELLVSQLFANDLRKRNREFTQFFKGYESVTDNDLQIVRIDDYLSYDNWTKTVE